MGTNAVLDGLELGDHVCVPADSGTGWRDFALAFAGAGLAANHRVIVLSDTPPPDQLRDLLAAGLPGGPAALARGQLLIRPARASYLPDGVFRPERLIEGLGSQIDLAYRDGYSGLRVSGDLTWVGRGGLDGHALARYEAGVNQLFLDPRVLGVCHYDPADFAEAVWRELVAVHPSTVRSGAGTLLSQLRCHRTDDPPGVRLEGEVDLTNQLALPGLLTTLTTMPGECVIDASGLRFAGARALAQLLQAAYARAGRPTTIVCLAPMARLLDVLGAGAFPDLTVLVPVPN
jgi:hypothetical protein